jgi:hypothetical protein
VIIVDGKIMFHCRIWFLMVSISLLSLEYYPSANIFFSDSQLCKIFPHITYWRIEGIEFPGVYGPEYILPPLDIWPPRVEFSIRIPKIKIGVDLKPEIDPMPPADPKDPKNPDPERKCEPIDMAVEDRETKVAQGATTSTTTPLTSTRTVHGCNPTPTPSNTATTTSACRLPTASVGKRQNYPPQLDPCTNWSWAVYPEDPHDKNNRQRLEAVLNQIGPKAQITYVSTSRAVASVNTGDSFFFVQYMTLDEADIVENTVSSSWSALL